MIKKLMNNNKKAFTLIELIVVMGILAILVMMGIPKLSGYIKEARFTVLLNDAKVIEEAAHRYYFEHNEWPRGEELTVAEAQALADKIYDQTGAVITLEATGHFYNLDMTKLAGFVNIKSNPLNYVLQNPVGSIYVLDPETNVRLPENNNDSGSTTPEPTPTPIVAEKPIAVISMTPEQGLTTDTTITWAYDLSTTQEGHTITSAEWQGKQDIYTTEGEYTVSLRVQSSNGLWSDWVEKSFYVINAQGVKQVAAGKQYTLALLNNGTVMAWGINNYGQLGLGDTLSRQTPVAIPNLTDIKMIAAGDNHALALKTNGSIMSWGRGVYGVLGTGNTNDKLSPALILDLENIIQIDAGDMHSLALKSDGTVWAWGWNTYGQLGVGNETDQLRPVVVPNLTAKQVVGGFRYSMAITSSGTVKAWGNNSDTNPLGVDTSEVKVLYPQNVAVLTNIKQIDICRHSMALDDNGNIWAWGYNAYGQLGLGDTINRNVPEQLPQITNGKYISVGYYHSMAITEDNKLMAWGEGATGRLGTNSYDDMNVPTLINDIQNAKLISLGYDHSFIVTENSKAMGCGANTYGQLGNGSTTLRKTFTEIISPIN